MEAISKKNTCLSVENEVNVCNNNTLNSDLGSCGTPLFSESCDNSINVCV